MTGATIWISVGFVGLGVSGPPMLELRLGVIALGCCWGAVRARVARAGARVRAAIDALGPG